MNGENSFWVEKENKLIKDLKSLLQSDSTDFSNIPSLSDMDVKTVSAVKAGVITKLDSLIV